MKKYLLSFILLAVGLCTASADKIVNGIIVTYDGTETSYKLEDIPTVKYETVDGVLYAVICLKDVPDPVLSIALADGQKLVVAYGEFLSSVIDNAVSDKASVTWRSGKMFIQGGRLIIIGKDGRRYNAAGVEINE